MAKTKEILKSPRAQRIEDSGEVRFSKKDLTIERYNYAIALDSLSSIAHEQRNLMNNMKNQDQISDGFQQASGKLHDMARQMFPLYPHKDFMVGQDWLKSNGYKVP